MNTNDTYDKKLKLLFSSLFSRKMPYVVFTHKDIDDKLLFTNISINDIMVYEPNTDQYMHSVLLKDPLFMEWIYATFPLLKEYKCIIDIRTFMAALNKTKDAYNTATLSLGGSDICITTSTNSVVCGQILDDETIEAYLRVFNGIDNTGLWTETKNLEPADIGKDFNIIEVVIDNDTLYNKENLLYRTILEPGKNVVSAAEFCKKSNEPCFIKLMTRAHRSAIRIKYVCISDSVYVESICPAMFWFPNKIVEFNKKEQPDGSSNQ